MKLFSGVTAIWMIGASLIASSAQAQRVKTVSAKPAKAAAAQKPTIIKVHCEWADFEFAPDGSIADVVDRDFKDDVKNTVAELKISPKTYTISWDRSQYTITGLRTLQHRYLINRESGQANIQTADVQQGMPTVPGNTDQKCTITN